MKCIVAVDKNWAIGKKNSLLYSVPEDMKFFRTTTIDSIVICGRKTLESFPNSSPLPKREHWILSSQYKAQHDSVKCFSSMEDLLSHAKNNPSEKIFVIGGASVYRALYQYCDEIYVTKIDSATADCDAFFPDLDRDSAFVISDKGERQVSKSGLVYQFLTYKNFMKKEL